MKFRRLITEFLIITALVFPVSLLVGFIYELVIHGKGKIDWIVSLRLSVFFGIILPLINSWDRWRKTN